MNTASSKKWAVRAFVFFLLWCVGFTLVCILGGCDFESPDVKFVSGLVVFAVDGDNYDDVTLSEGIVQECVVKSAAAFTYSDGSIIKVGGLEFTTTYDSAHYFVPNTSGPGYNVDTDAAGVRSTSVTEDSGYCEFSAWNSLWGVYSSCSSRRARGKRTDETNVAYGGFCNWKDPRTNWTTLIPWFDKVEVPGHGIVTGGHYRCKGAPYQGTVGATTVRPQPDLAAAGMQSVEDTAFLANTEVSKPQRGVTVAGSSWCMRVGPNGQGYGRKVDNLTALEHSKTETLEFRATPYYLSVQAVCAEPVDTSLVGVSADCVLRCGDIERDISATITAVSDDGFRVVVHSDYIIPIDSRDYVASTVPMVLYDRWTCPADANDLSADIYAPLFREHMDPNSYDPNNISESNIWIDRLNPDRYVPVHCVPVQKGQRIVIEFRGHFPPELVLYVAKHWLTGNKTLDFTGDGIVNMNDYPF